MPCPALKLRALSPLAFAVSLAGCELSSLERGSLAIVSPEAGMSLATADDVDPGLAGTQIGVEVEARGIRDGARLELYRVDEQGVPEGPGATRTVREGRAWFSRFTLEPGPNQLQARLQGSQLTSAAVAVTLSDPCGTLTFVEPRQGAEAPTRLGPDDDRDAEACGDTFTTRVIASTGLPDGTEVVLLVDERENTSAQTVGGVAVFDAVELEPRGPGLIHLSLRTASPACRPVALDTDLIVDCDGPPCLLTGPKGPDLSADDDRDPMGAGLQASFAVETGEQVELVQLLVNGDIDHAIGASVRRGRANFPGVTLPEGKGVRVKAVCQGTGGARSADERLFNVDTVPCGAELTLPSAGSVFAQQASPAEPPADRFEVPVRAEVDSDCVGVRLAVLPNLECAGVGDAEQVPLPAGQGSVNATLTLSRHGEQAVCMEVSDAAGNRAVTGVDVFFDTQAPQLSIESPAADVAYGAGDDGDPTTPECDVPMQVRCDERGAVVQLVLASSRTALAMATCAGGRAVFPSVPLPRRDAPYIVVARAVDANGLTGTSQGRSVNVQRCEP